MSYHTKLDEKLEGSDKFQSWKHRISLFLEENELGSYIHEEVPVPEGDEAKALHKKKMGSEDQALTVHSKKGRRKPHYSKGKDPHHKDN